MDEYKTLNQECESCQRLKKYGGNCLGKDDLRPCLIQINIENNNNQKPSF